MVTLFARHLRFYPRDLGAQFLTVGGKLGLAHRFEPERLQAGQRQLWRLIFVDHRALPNGPVGYRTRMRCRDSAVSPAALTTHGGKGHIRPLSGWCVETLGMPANYLPENRN